MIEIILWNNLLDIKLSLLFSKYKFKTKNVKLKYDNNN